MCSNVARQQVKTSPLDIQEPCFNRARSGCVCSRLARCPETERKRIFSGFFFFLSVKRISVPLYSKCNLSQLWNFKQNLHQTTFPIWCLQWNCLKLQHELAMAKQTPLWLFAGQRTPLLQKIFLAMLVHFFGPDCSISILDYHCLF